MTGIASGALAVGMTWLVVGCTESAKPGPAPSVSSSAATAIPASTTASASVTAAPGAPAERELQPVYPVDAGAPDPLAQRFCDAIHVLPEKRAGECCGARGAAGEVMGGQCVRTLTFALSQHAVSLAAADVDRCVEAMTQATAGCDWVTPGGRAPIAAACEGIIKGTIAEKTACRSSLECSGNLRCQGLSTIDMGKCGPAKEAKQACNLAVDMLATFTRQEQVNRDHPECEGHCVRARCETSIAEGGVCESDAVCGKGHCAGGKCTSAPLPAVGEACTDSCVPGARCFKGKCIAPHAEGEACSANEECRGACERGDGGATGRCLKSCAVVRLPILKNLPSSKPK
ncbi:Hypothetical protein A7982_08281 [Minicystis rosea]|nr:Hypothetical protein A7982_08281 [Minicystis rosea]